MIVAKPYTQDFADIWNEFVKNSKAPMFMFERGYMDYHANRFKDASLLFYDESKLIAVLPATEHDGEIRSHGGLTYGGMFVGEKIKQHTMIECFECMRDFYRQLGVRSLVYKEVPYIYATQPNEDAVYALFRMGAVISKIEPSTVINLKSPYRMPKGRKSQISRARREGVVVNETDDFDSFMSLENSVLSERHNLKAVHTAEELRLLKSRFPDRIKCVGGFLGGKLIAGTVLFVYDTVVHTQYMAADDAACRVGALDLIIADQISRYNSTHFYLDFGISSEDGGAFLNEGLISQKEGFGGRTLCYRTWSVNL